MHFELPRRCFLAFLPCGPLLYKIPLELHLKTIIGALFLQFEFFFIHSHSHYRIGIESQSPAWSCSTEKSSGLASAMSRTI